MTVLHIIIIVVVIIIVFLNHEEEKEGEGRGQEEDVDISFKGATQTEWRRVTKADMPRSGHFWKEVEKTAQSRVLWRSVVGGLCSSWGKRPNPTYPLSEQQKVSAMHAPRGKGVRP